MDKICVFFVVALALNQALGMNLRPKRQLNNNEDELEDRYAEFNGRPNWNRLPGQNRFPNQGQFGQGQFGQGQFGQGQFGQGQFGQGQGQFGQGQGQFGQGPNGQGQFGQGQPGQGQGNPNQGQFPEQQTTTTPSSVSTTTTLAPAVDQCIRRCPVTPEYNPVCGSNNVTYDNPGRLICAQSCGVGVTLQRSARCPAATASG